MGRRALSREGKKILHVDQNGYYGSSEAAFSLQDAQEWVDSVKKGMSVVDSDAMIANILQDLQNSQMPKSAHQLEVSLT